MAGTCDKAEKDWILDHPTHVIGSFICERRDQTQAATLLLSIVPYALTIDPPRPCTKQHLTTEVHSDLLFIPSDIQAGRKTLCSITCSLRSFLFLTLASHSTIFSIVTFFTTLITRTKTALIRSTIELHQSDNSSLTLGTPCADFRHLRSLRNWQSSRNPISCKNGLLSKSSTFMSEAGNWRLCQGGS